MEYSTKYALVLWEHWVSYYEAMCESNKSFHPFKKYIHLFMDGYESPYVIPYYINVMILQFDGSLEVIWRLGIDKDYGETTDEGDDDDDDDDYESDC